MLAIGKTHISTINVSIPRQLDRDTAAADVLNIPAAVGADGDTALLAVAVDVVDDHIVGAVVVDGCLAGRDEGGARGEESGNDSGGVHV